MTIERKVIARTRIVRGARGLKRNFFINLKYEKLSDIGKQEEYREKRNILYSLQEEGKIDLSRSYPIVNLASVKDYNAIRDEFVFYEDQLKSRSS